MVEDQSFSQRLNEGVTDGPEDQHLVGRGTGRGDSLQEVLDELLPILLTTEVLGHHRILDGEPQDIDGRKVNG